MTFIDRIEHSILNSPPVNFLRNKSKQIVLPGFEKVPLYDVIIFFLSQVKKVGMTERAAAIAFNLLLAIPAATIFLCTLIPYLPIISKQVTAELLLLTKDITMNYTTYTAVKGFLEDFLLTQRSGLLSLGFVLAIYYASNAMICIMRSFNRSLLYKNKRSFFQERMTAIRLTTLIVLIVLASMIMLVTEGVLLDKIQQWLRMKGDITSWLITILRWVIIIPLFFYALAFTYKYAPAVHKRWRLSSPGAIFATFLIVSSTFLFSFWVTHFATYNKIYGSIGTLLVIMLLIYINSLILLVGYELNVSIHSLKAIAEERQRHERAAEQAKPKEAQVLDISGKSD